MCLAKIKLREREAGWWFSSGTLVSYTNKTDRHEITETLTLQMRELQTNTVNYVCVYYGGISQMYPSPSFF
jgi:hypothetical protein